MAFMTTFYFKTIELKKKKKYKNNVVMIQVIWRKIHLHDLFEKHI